MAEVTASTVPLIDIPKIRLWTPSERQEQGAIVRQGFRTPGFVQGVEDPNFTQRVRAAMPRLMERDFGELLGYYKNDLVGVRGYTPLFSETALKERSLPDLKDMFDIPIFDVEHELWLPVDMYDEIRWIREEIKARAISMFRLLAFGYGLPENFFVDMVKDSEHSILRFLRYPSVDFLAGLLGRIVKGDCDDLPFPIVQKGMAFLFSSSADAYGLRALAEDERSEELAKLILKAERSQEHADMGFLAYLVPSSTDGLYIRPTGEAEREMSTDADRSTWNSGDMAVEYTTYHHPDDPMASTIHGVRNSRDRTKPRYALAAFFHLRREIRLNERFTAGEFHDFRTKKTIVA